MPKVYLGDSVYADIENGVLVLTTDNGAGTSNKIYLEPEVFRALIAFTDPKTSAAITEPPAVENPLDTWINKWCEERGSAVEIWGDTALHQKIYDLVKANHSVVSLMISDHEGDSEKTLRQLADDAKTLWARKDFQELAFEDNIDVAELILVKYNHQ